MSTGLAALATIAGEGRNEQEELAFLKTKAREGKHWSLMSSTLLEEAKMEMRYVRMNADCLDLRLTRHSMASIPKLSS